MEEYAVRTRVTRISRTIDENVSRRTSSVIGSTAAALNPDPPARSAGCRGRPACPASRAARRSSRRILPRWPGPAPGSPRAGGRGPRPGNRGPGPRTRPGAARAAPPRGLRRLRRGAPLAFGCASPNSEVQLEGLAAVAEIEGAEQLLLLGREALALELLAGGSLHLGEGGPQGGQALAQEAHPGADVVVLDVGGEKPQGREIAR